jgi:hypothetical protein
LVYLVIAAAPLAYQQPQNKGQHCLQQGVTLDRVCNKQHEWDLRNERAEGACSHHKQQHAIDLQTRQKSTLNHYQ